ncbi:O-antigen ligase family protein, partial [Candidatus Pelagibacter sp.]|nr:O-antigen ligase family protein [Candidatus Pelagibacter sp.]
DDRLYDRYIESPIKSMGLETKNKEKFLFTEAHDSLYRTSWNMFLDKPILGHGPKLFRVKCMDLKYAEGVYPCSSHPHNFYLQLLAETGAIGFSFLVGVCFYFMYLMMRFILSYFKDKTKYLSDYQICLLAGLLITIWPITSNGNFFSNHLMLFYSLQMGFFRKKV